MKNNKSKFKSSGSTQQGQFDKKFINDDFIIDVPTKAGQLNSECLYEVILWPKIATKFFKNRVLG